MIKSTPTWVDDFLFWDAIIVSLFILADWLLGERNRARMRERLGVWWLYVSCTPFVGFAAKDAVAIRRVAKWIFGDRLFSLRCFFFAILIGLALRTQLLRYFANDINEESTSMMLIYFLLPLILFNAMMDYLSVILTLYFLKLMEDNTSLLVLIALLLTDAFVTVVLCIAIPLVNCGYSLSIWFIFGRGHEGWLELLFYSWIVSILFFFPCLLPTLIHLFFSSIFLLSKLFRPLIQKPTEFILLRFYQSKKGVLTAIATALGVAAKLIQEFMKL